MLRPGGRFVFVTAYRPSPQSLHYWVARTFNGLMWLRNLLLRPPFIMYYLSFLLPEVETLFRRQGLDVTVAPLGMEEWPWNEFCVVTALKSSFAPLVVPSGSSYPGD